MSAAGRHTVDVWCYFDQAGATPDSAGFLPLRVVDGTKGGGMGQTGGTRNRYMASASGGIFENGPLSSDHQGS